jgi:hypothetical protein
VVYFFAFILCLSFVLLRQKWRVFFISSTSLFVPKWPNEEFVDLFLLTYSIRQKHFHIRDIVFLENFQKNIAEY